MVTDLQIFPVMLNEIQHLGNNLFSDLVLIVDQRAGDHSFIPNVLLVDFRYYGYIEFPMQAGN